MRSRSYNMVILRDYSLTVVNIIIVGSGEGGNGNLSSVIFG